MDYIQGLDSDDNPEFPMEEVERAPIVANNPTIVKGRKNIPRLKHCPDAEQEIINDAYVFFKSGVVTTNMYMKDVDLHNEAIQAFKNAAAKLGFHNIEANVAGRRALVVCRL